MFRIFLLLFIIVASPYAGKAESAVAKNYLSGHKPSTAIVKSVNKSSSSHATYKKRAFKKNARSRASSRAAKRARLVSINTDIKTGTRRALSRGKSSRTAKKKSVKVSSQKSSVTIPAVSVEKEKEEAPIALAVEPAKILKQPNLKSIKLPNKQIDPVPVEVEGSNFSSVGPFTTFNESNYYSINKDGTRSILTLDRDMQDYAEKLLGQYKVPWGAIVAMDPKTGEVISLAGHSAEESNGQSVATRNTFPAASLFKIITAAAAVETSGYKGNTEVSFRGGTYSLGKHNYLPNKKKDTRRMSLGLAMGKSCNPVFARVALNDLSTDVIKKYANNFGFNKSLAQDFALKPSTLDLDTDSYSLARTAAGFGSALISPVHAASIAGAVGNGGIMMRPYIVDHLNDKSGRAIAKTQPEMLARAVSYSTANELLDMMSITISEGTARKHFKTASSNLKSISIAAKTGTLSGKSPKGVYHWFVAVAPVEKPTIAIAALVVDNGRSRINGVGIGKKYLERYFANKHSSEHASHISEENLKAPKPLG